MFKAGEYVKDLKDMVKEIEDEWTRLTREQSKIDRAVSDIEHFIENTSNLNAAAGYNIYKDLKNILEIRREIKDAINEIRPLKDWARQPQTNINRMDQLATAVYKQIDLNESKRVYKTRVLKSEFGDLIEKQD